LFIVFSAFQNWPDCPLPVSKSSLSNSKKSGHPIGTQFADFEKLSAIQKLLAPASNLLIQYKIKGTGKKIMNICLTLS
jgi:hypothetical protein